MVLTTHALTGAVIGKNIGNPWIIVPVSLAVHYLMDGILHAEYFDSRTAKVKDAWWKIVIDLFIGTAIIFFFVFFERPDMKIASNVALGAFFSLFPDGITLIHYLSGRRSFKRIKHFHSLAHRYDKNPKYSSQRQWNLRNARNDIIISILATIILFLL